MSTPVSTKPPDATTATSKPQRSLASRILTRPEIGAIAAAIVIFIFFFSIAAPFRTLPAFGTVLYASSTIGIVAVGVALLMIGGEFDLSAGVVGGDLRPGRGADLLPALRSNMWVGVWSR